MKLSIFIYISLFLKSILFAQINCGNYFLGKFSVDEAKDAKIAFSKIIHTKDSKLHTSKNIEANQARQKRLGLTTTQKPSEKITSFIDILEKIHSRATVSEIAKKRLRAYYHNKYIIKAKEVPDSYYEFQKKLARQRGHGDINLTPQMKSKIAQDLIQDQKQSLDNWFNYFLSEDANAYPFYAKKWSFESMLKLSKFDPQLARFSKRSKTTVSTFPELNREALAKVVDDFDSTLKGISIQGPDKYLKLLKNADFGKAYGFHLKEIHELSLRNTKIHGTVKGKWIKYKQGSDHMPLVKSLEGKNTGWCTAGEGTAKSQLQDGDFHIFYSLDEANNPTIPRIAIRMNRNSIAEIRGVSAGQNLDEAISGSDVLKNKLTEFGQEGQKYYKKERDMQILTSIEKKYKDQQTLDKDDLRFLYEMDTEIEGFGYQRDPRINEILKDRNIKEDIAYVVNVRPSQVSINENEALQGGILYHHGELFLYGISSLNNSKLPKSIGGTLYLGGIKSANELKDLPKSINGNLYLDGIKSANGLEFPDFIKGNISLNGLESAKGLKLPPTINSSLSLNGIKSSQGLSLPEFLNGDLSLAKIESAIDLKLPNSIKGSLNLESIKSTKGLKLPNLIEGTLFLNSLSSANGLKLPNSLKGLNLNGLKTADGLQLPASMKGNLNLDGLEYAHGLNLPDFIGGTLSLEQLKSIDGIKLPKSIEGHLNLNKLKSAQGAKLPESIKGHLFLEGLESIQGLKLPKKLNGHLVIRESILKDIQDLIKKEGLDIQVKTFNR
ncbi:MAG: hypothetical protein N4A33_01925 [Bacteriovoracaceae bacterium]|jgi:hypothetical protein|nr:hypothetical protein [Bacteriovoracaceae bacterium]